MWEASDRSQLLAGGGLEQVQDAHGRNISDYNQVVAVVTVSASPFHCLYEDAIPSVLCVPLSQGVNWCVCAACDAMPLAGCDWCVCAACDAMLLAGCDWCVCAACDAMPLTALSHLRLCLSRRFLTCVCASHGAFSLASAPLTALSHLRLRLSPRFLTCVCASHRALSLDAVPSLDERNSLICAGK